MRSFYCFMISVGVACALFAGCSQAKIPTAPPPLPEAVADESSPFGVDKNINIKTIDGYLERDDVCYRDVRMLFDPADYAAIGGDADLTRTIKGFKVVPYPFIATLSPLPVSGAYDGPCLYSLAWNEDGSIASAQANYEESDRILEELFPKDQAIFLMCGGGGYSGMLKSLLIFGGWDAKRIYNVGANWSYTGNNKLELIVYGEEAGSKPVYATWRADYAYIDFSRLHPVVP